MDKHTREIVALAAVLLVLLIVAILVKRAPAQPAWVQTPAAFATTTRFPTRIPSPQGYRSGMEVK